MGSSDSDGRVGGSQFKKWASAGALFAGLVGIAVTAIVITGAQLVSSPMATAGTTRATPWVPIPAFLGKPAPHPGTKVSAQGMPNPEEVQKGQNWAARATPPFQAIQTSMSDLSTALNNGNVEGMKSACMAINNASEKLDKTLPTPKDDLTNEVKATVDEITQMYNACMADPPDTQGVAQHGTAANNHMVQVAKLSQS